MGQVSSQNRLLAVGVKRKALTESSHPVEATLTNRIILRIEKTISNHISNLPEGLRIKTTGGKRSGSQPQATGDEGRFGVEGNGVFVGRDVHITANKNTVPFDPESPFVTSGLRLGTAALTTRGFDAQAFREVADVIADRLLNPEDDSIRQRCLDRVAALCERFPLYADSKQPVLA